MFNGTFHRRWKRKERLLPNYDINRQLHSQSTGETHCLLVFRVTMRCFSTVEYVYLNREDKNQPERVSRPPKDQQSTLLTSLNWDRMRREFDSVQRGLCNKSTIIVSTFSDLYASTKAFRDNRVKIVVE